MQLVLFELGPARIRIIKLRRNQGPAYRRPGVWRVANRPRKRANQAPNRTLGPLYRHDSGALAPLIARRGSQIKSWGCGAQQGGGAARSAPPPSEQYHESPPPQHGNTRPPPPWSYGWVLPASSLHRWYHVSSLTSPLTSPALCSRQRMI